MSVLNQPLIGFDDGGGMVAVDVMLVGKESRSLIWMPVRTLLATIAPGVHGLVTSRIVARNRAGVNLCAREPVAITSVVITEDTIVDMDDASRTISFFDASGSRAWLPFHLRFREARPYWTFVRAVAEAKVSAEERNAGIVAAFGKMMAFIPRQYGDQGDGEDQEDVEAVGGERGGRGGDGDGEDEDESEGESEDESEDESETE